MRGDDQDSRALAYEIGMVSPDNENFIREAENLYLEFIEKIKKVIK